MRTNVYVTLATLLAFGQVHAQGGFNRRYDPLGQHEVQFGWSVEAMDDGRIICIGNSHWTDSVNYSSVITTLELDPSGELISEHRWESPWRLTYPGWCNGTDHETGGLICGGGGYI